MTGYQAINDMATFVMCTAVAYFLVTIALGVRHLRRHRISLSDQALLPYGNPFATALVGTSRQRRQRSRRSLYFLIPCLNEAAVIARTVSALRDPTRRSRIVVVDDASDDETGIEAASTDAANVVVLRRELPDAQQGKGAALNVGFAYIVDDVVRRRLNPADVIVVVMDADGRLSDAAVDHVLQLFDDPKVGAAQLAVRIRNRTTNFLLEFQNHQFWTLSSLTQFGRIATSTVSLGGNGQFNRLSALLDIGPQPWSASLTEDLDLSVSLAVAGWKLTSTPNASVDQQGVETLRALLRQRTRWYQGHMSEARRLPEIFATRSLGHAAALEMTLYLLVPWLFDLPWSVLYHLILFELVMRARSMGAFGGDPLVTVLVVVGSYILGFWPALLTTVLSKVRDRTLPWRTALKLGHAFVLTNYLSYVCAWRALYRLLCGHTSWVKTERLIEDSDEVEPASAAVSSA